MSPSDWRYRSYRFTETGVSRIRRTPKKAQTDRSPSKWSDAKSRFDSFYRKLPRGVVVTESSALLYIVSASDLEATEQRMDLLSYFGDNLHTVSIETERKGKLEVDFTATSGNRKQRIKGLRQALRFSLTSRPFAGQNFKSRLELAGLKGDLQIYLDEEMRVPLEVRGKAGWFGTLRLRLHSVVLR